MQPRDGMIFHLQGIESLYIRCSHLVHLLTCCSKAVHLY